MGFSKEDVAQIERHGLTQEGVQSTVDKLERTPRFVHLVKAATKADGVVEMTDPDELATAFDRLERVPSKFTPMSGAASRMFGFLGRFLAKSLKEGDAEKVDELIRGLTRGSDGPKFAFLDELDDRLQQDGLTLDTMIETGEHRAIVEYILEEKGLGYRGKPKAVIPCHSRDGRAVTPLEEHMREALVYAGGRLHATISPEHEALFHDALARIRRESPDLDAVEVSFSFQESSTDSVAIDGTTKEITRDENGEIAFFPAGHGSLLRNIDRLKGPVVLRNVDNTPKSTAARAQVAKYHHAFAVLLHRIKELIGEVLDEIESGAADEATLERALVGLRKLNLQLLLSAKDYEKCGFEEKKRLLRDALDRPIKIVGVVKNEGEPGGGPFVIESRGHRFVSIVEKAEISSEQRPMMVDGGFFNPVDIVADPTDHRGRPFDLDRFINHDRYFIVRKPYRGREVIRMEHPGLWNGAMDGWTSLFVVMPIETFAPVKEVNDLLRSQHQDD